MLTADAPKRPSHARSKQWRGASTNGPLLKADDFVIESKDYKEAKKKQTLSYGMRTQQYFHTM